jgi:GxxExxY protein
VHPDHITGDVIELAIRIHREVGPGLLESVYEAILEYELKRMGYRVRRQQGIRFTYHDLVFNDAFRADLIVEDTVVLELKSTAKVDDSAPSKLRTYLRLTDAPVGLILNFGLRTMLAGVKRVVNNLPPLESSQVRINRTPNCKPVRTSAEPTPDHSASPRPREKTVKPASTRATAPESTAPRHPPPDT